MTLSTYEEFAPVPWWAWSDTMNKAEMRRQLRMMKKGGIRQFFIYASYGMMYPEFLSDEWWDYVGFTIEECKKLGLYVWIYDDLAWPSGTAAGHVLQEHPEHRCRLIVCNKYEIPAGGSFIYTGGSLPLEVLCSQDGNWIPIALDENKHWLNDTGKTAKIICMDVRFYNGVELSCKRSGGTWNQRGYIDMLDAEAVKCWMQYIHIPYKEKFGQYFGKTVRGFFFDEPTMTPYTAYYSNAELMYYGQGPCIVYTNGLFEKFEKRYGYDLRGKIHTLFFDCPDSTRVRNDYWAMVTEMMSLAFGKTLYDWCEENNLLLTGHSNQEEPPHYRSRIYLSGEIYELEKYEHIPGADLLFYRTPFRGNPELPTPGYGKNAIYDTKLPVAIARYAGAKRAMVEVFGVRGSNGIMAEQKDINDFIAAMGVNFVNDNTLMYAMSPVTGGKAFTQPWFKHYSKFCEMSARLSEFAAWGWLDTEIAVLSPESTYRALAPMDRDTPCDTCVGDTMNDTLYGLMTSHIDFEVIFESVIAEAPVKKGTLAAPNSAFRLLVLPFAKVLSDAVAEKLVQFCRGGGKVIFTGCRPECTDNRPLSPAEKRCFDAQPLLANDAHLADALRETVEKIVKLKYQLTGKGTDKVVTALRNNKGEYRLMVSNQGEEPVRFTLSAPVMAGCKALDPDSGNHWKPVEKQTGKFSLELYPEQSLILEKSADCGKKPVVFTFPKKKVDIGLKEQWNYELGNPNCVACCMEFSPAYGKMAEDPSLLKEWIPIDRSGLQDYLVFNPTEYPWYWIRADFTIQGERPKDLKLILPTKEHKNVFLNGKEIRERKSCCYYNPFNYEVDISQHIRSGVNSLLIKVHTVEWYRESPARYEMPTFPPMVLTGSFATDITGRQTILKPLPKHLVSGDIALQGFPQYCGEITYIQNVCGAGDCKSIKVEPLKCGSLELEINGKKCGVRAWEPYLFDCSGKWRTGSNNIALRLTTAWGNLLPGGYIGKDLPLVFGFKELNAFSDID